MNRILYIICVLIAFMALSATAASKEINIIGRVESVVTSSEITLGDIAEVSSSRSHRNDEAVVVLKQTVVATSPAPGKSKDLAAQEILQVLRAHQVNFEQVGYSLPASVVVTRASRVVKDEEITAALERAVHDGARGDIIIKDLVKSDTIAISPTMVSFVAEPMGIPHNGRLSFSVTAQSPEGEKQSFPVQAYVEEWAEVPLAKRALTKGAVIALEDVAMARLNLQAIPRDVVRESSELIGLETSQDIRFGDYFKSKAVGIPALVRSGEKVITIVKSNTFEVTLKATALDSGSMGTEVRIRNDASKKVLRGKVVGEKMVEVLP